MLLNLLYYKFTIQYYYYSFLFNPLFKFHTPEILQQTQQNHTSINFLYTAIKISFFIIIVIFNNFSQLFFNFYYINFCILHQVLSDNSGHKLNYYHTGITKHYIKYTYLVQSIRLLLLYQCDNFLYVLIIYTYMCCSLQKECLLKYIYDTYSL